MHLRIAKTIQVHHQANSLFSTTALYFISDIDLNAPIKYALWSFDFSTKTRGWAAARKLPTRRNEHLEIQPSLSLNLDAEPKHFSSLKPRNMELRLTPDTLICACFTLRANLGSASHAWPVSGTFERRELCVNLSLVFYEFWWFSTSMDTGATPAAAAAAHLISFSLFSVCSANEFVIGS